MTEQEENQEKEARLIKLITITVVSGLLLIGVKFGFLFGFTPSKELKIWVDTATIFTGVATPILSTVSVFLLYFVWKDNRRELAATKQALIEQSDTQNFSVIKEAVFEIADQVKVCLQKDVVRGMVDDRWILSSVSSPIFLNRFSPDNEGKEQRKEMKLELFLQEYFTFTRDKTVEKNRQNDSMRDLIFSTPTFEFIDKVKTIGLFLQGTKSIKYKKILEITLFAKLTIFTWLMFVEISFHLFKTTNDEEKEIAELVFKEIAGLKCRQLK